MIILQHHPPQDEILDFIDQCMQQLAEAGSEARYVVMGPDAFAVFRQAVAARLSRKPKDFGTYNYLPVVVDPFRGDAVCVLPEPREMKGGVQAFEIPG
ncbi:MAG: hypothetical protein JJ896_14840 [Rhodothermales bacterium]|nr:hypothetical protein [Rhodothermales bacterium]MBO6780928.1 hypothetical protein [Rhodothermales bacterium]